MEVKETHTGSNPVPITHISQYGIGSIMDRSKLGKVGSLPACNNGIGIQPGAFIVAENFFQTKLTKD